LGIPPCQLWIDCDDPEKAQLPACTKPDTSCLTAKIIVIISSIGLLGVLVF